MGNLLNHGGQFIEYGLVTVDTALVECPLRDGHTVVDLGRLLSAELGPPQEVLGVLRTRHQSGTHRHLPAPFPI